MFKKRNLLFLSLFTLGVLLLSSCFLNPPATEGILKGQIMVPEGTLLTKDLTGQALPDATVNIIDLATGAIIATTVTDASGYYQVSVPAGGPYLLEAVKDGVKLEQMTCSVEVGKEYDLGTADCMTTSAALIAQAMMDAGDNPADIDCAAIIADPNFDDVSSIVCSIIKAGGDPTESALVQQAVEDFLNPPAPTPTPTPTPPAYTVTYDGNGSTGGTTPTDSSLYEYGATVTVLGNTGTLVKTGYTFDGWNTAADGSDNGGTDYNENDTFTMGSANVTLYAQWTANNYTITFDKDDTGATGTMAGQIIASGSSANLTACAFSKTGWGFDGWAETSGGTVSYADQASYTMGTENVTLYAQWTINSYTVTFDSQDGSGVSPQTVNHGGLVTEPTAPAKEGYTFGGWYKESGCTNAWDFATDTVTSNVTLYAQWTPLYALRDTGPAGGLIFYVKEGGYSDDWMYLEAALTDSLGAPWGCYGTEISGADGTAVGTGKQNTIDIEAGCITAGTAANICANLIIGIYEDWFLPSKDELNKMWVNLKSGTDENNFTYDPVGGFADSSYWSSSEFDAYNAWYQNFDYGYQNYYNKHNARRVRAVRAF